MSIIGNIAPNFACQGVINKKIKEISLDSFENKYKILFFYPLNFTFVCPTEIHALQEKIDEFSKRNVQVIGISVDSVHSHLAWLNMPKSKGGIQGITYPLLSDINKTISCDYGVLHSHDGIALRGLFLLDKNNIVQYGAIHNLSLGRNISEIIRVIDALHHVEQNGNVCPANWTPDKKSMKPDNVGLLDYFDEISR